MTQINPNALLGIFVAIAAIGLIGTLNTQSVFAEETSAVDDLKDIINSITALATTLIGVIGTVIAIYLKIGKKFGLLTKTEIKKLEELQEELKSTDKWAEEIDEKLIQIVDVVSSLPGGKDMIDKSSINLAKWKTELEPMDENLSNLHAKLKEVLQAEELSQVLELAAKLNTIRKEQLP